MTSPTGSEASEAIDALRTLVDAVEKHVPLDAAVDTALMQADAVLAAEVTKSEAMQAVCIAAGWPYCTEHDKPLYDGSNPCARLHAVVDEVRHDQACSWPNDDCICGAFA